MLRVCATLARCGGAGPGVAFGHLHRFGIRDHRRQPATALGVLELLALGGELALRDYQRLLHGAYAEPSLEYRLLEAGRVSSWVAARAVAQQLVESRL